MALSILVVDDEPALAEALSELLRTNGHEVVAATTPGQALAAAARTPFHLVIADLAMPRTAGDELLQLMRSRGQQPFWFALMSAMPTDVIAHRLEEADRFLSKPVRLQALTLVCDDCQAALDARPPRPDADSN